MQLEKDTFIDPNGDNLTYTTVQIPKWLKFDAQKLLFNGTTPATEYGVYNVTLLARDAWNASASLTFEIVSGIKPNKVPIINAVLTD